MRIPPLAVLAASLSTSACAGWQSALDPHSAEAGHLARLFWFFAAVCAAIWILVTASLLYIRLRGPKGPDAPQDDGPHEMRRKTIIVGGLTVMTAAILAVFTLASFYATRGFAWSNSHALKIKLTGHQWWWEVEYEDQNPARIFATANEIRIPTGRPVTLDLVGADVIHSFWVPDLMGKKDMIPGRTNNITIETARPGLYRGQCAEYCGLQHAHMALFLLAEPPRAFAAWQQHQLQPAAAPRDHEQAAGLRLFLGGTCAGCHSVQGTGAGGDLGPDLTHFGSRATIAAGLLPNTAANLSHWLADPQGLKPGCYMPKVPLGAGERAALVDYLESLR